MGGGDSAAMGPRWSEGDQKVFSRRYLGAGGTFREDGTVWFSFSELTRVPRARLDRRGDP